jgi:hypothetical protein
MNKIKNLPVAYSFQIIFCLIWIVMIFLYGYKGFMFIIVGILRPFVLKYGPISKGETLPWKMYYVIVVYAIITTSCLIILFYFINLFLLPSEFVNINKPKIFLSLFPLFFLVHGIFGLVYLYFSSKYT